MNKIIKVNEGFYVVSTTEEEIHNYEGESSILPFDLIEIKNKIEVIGYGGTSKMHSSFTDKIMIKEKDYIKDNATEKGVEVVEYKCYCSTNKRSNGLLLHEDSRSSFNCALSVIGNPKFVFILKIDEDNKEKFDKLCFR